MTRARSRAPSRPIAKSDVVLVPFPFTDLSTQKLRPAVVLHASREQSDFALAFVSSRDIGRVDPGEIAILPSHPEFRLAGLASPSKVRATKLVTLSASLIRRWLGRLGPLLTADLDRALVAALGINVIPYREEGRADERARLAALSRSGGAASVIDDLGA